MSLVFAVIAAFVVILAGFLSDVRIGTILLRGLLGFLTAGLAGYLFVSFFEGRQKELERERMSRDREDEEQMSYVPKDEDYRNAEGAEASDDFRPLTEQNLEHVQPPES